MATTGSNPTASTLLTDRSTDRTECPTATPSQPLGGRRPLRQLTLDEGGQLTTEWVLLVATVVVPLGLLSNGILIVMKIFFYRVTGTIALPFI